MRIAIIGAGLIGHKRVAAIKRIKSLTLEAVCDVDERKARVLSAEYGGEVFTDWKDVIARPDIGMVIVATPNYLLAPIALAAVRNKKHVLIEKPGAIRSRDLRKILITARRNHVGVWVGYNHRFHPAVVKAHELLSRGKVGKPLYMRASYGHGGRKGYDKGWRAFGRLSGGGEFLDQGSHLIDLFQYFIGKPKLKFASLKTYFWKMPVEDNAFAVLETKEGQTGFLHASWTQWKNLFLLEVFCTKGALVIRGLGRSYGPETLTLYIRRPAGGAPRQKTWRWMGVDDSFLKETKAFAAAIRNTRAIYSRFEEAIKTLAIIEGAYH